MMDDQLSCDEPQRGLFFYIIAGETWAKSGRDRSEVKRKPKSSVFIGRACKILGEK